MAIPSIKCAFSREIAQKMRANAREKLLFGEGQFTYDEWISFVNFSTVGMMRSNMTWSLRFVVNCWSSLKERNFDPWKSVLSMAVRIILNMHQYFKFNWLSLAYADIFITIDKIIYNRVIQNRCPLYTTILAYVFTWISRGFENS